MKNNNPYNGWGTNNNNADEPELYTENQTLILNKNDGNNPDPFAGNETMVLNKNDNSSANAPSLNKASDNSYNNAVAPNPYANNNAPNLNKAPDNSYNNAVAPNPYANNNAINLSKAPDSNSYNNAGVPNPYSNNNSYNNPNAQNYYANPYAPNQQNNYNNPSMPIPPNGMPDQSWYSPAEETRKNVIIIVLSILVPIIIALGVIGAIVGLVFGAVSNVKESDDYKMAYSYVVDSNKADKLNAYEDDIKFKGYKASANFAAEGTSHGSKTEYAFNVKGTELTVVCHKNEADECYVCKECTEFN